MGPRQPDEHLSPGAYFIAIRDRLQPAQAAGLHESYEFRVDGRVFEVRVEDGICTTSEGSTNGPAAVFTMSTETLDQVFLGQVTADRAIADGSVQVTGDLAALDRFQHLLAT